MSFDFSPRLSGQLVSLRPIQAADFDDLYAVAADPLIWEQHPAKDRHEAAQFQEFFGKALEANALLVIDSATRQIIGSSRYHAYDETTREVEIGWTFLSRTYWGGAYNGEIKQLMLRHAFAFVDRVIFLVGEDNTRSQKAVEKIGGRRAGSRADASGNASYVYEITREMFADMRLPPA